MPIIADAGNSRMSTWRSRWPA